MKKIGNSMKQNPYVMNPANMSRATSVSKNRISELFLLVDEIKTDARKLERMSKHECKACFYFSRIGGQAITERGCMCCGMEQTYGSTSTDVLCLECAKKHKLCKHCGGDVNMKNRNKWPTKGE